MSPSDAIIALAQLFAKTKQAGSFEILLMTYHIVGFLYEPVQNFYYSS